MVRSKSMTNLHVVVGGQYGSEAKGATVAHLSRDLAENDVVIRVAGPNAGHTAYDDRGREWKLRAVPVAAVANPRCQLHIAAGSEVDFEVLNDEVSQLEMAGIKVINRLTVHPMATVLEPVHRSMESVSKLVDRVGSTGKGIGAARAARIMREAKVVREVVRDEQLCGTSGPFDLDGVGTVIVEGTQGYGLGLHHRNYPQVTSSDCTAMSFLSMAGIAPWSSRIFRTQVHIVARVYPIRVAGNSGPLEGETTWAELGLPEERTTVTNNIRRVGQWDADLLEEAIRANGGGDWNADVQLTITMLDQLFPEVKGVTRQDDLSDRAIEWLTDVQDENETEVTRVGTSPTTMFEVSF